MKFLILGTEDYAKPFRLLGDVTFDGGEFSSCDVVVFTGGADVDPSVYKEKTGEFTRSEIARDRDETMYYDYARAEGKPMVGICRGAQFGCAMSGGSLIQHSKNHNNCHHQIFTNDGRIIDLMAGDHHQMMMPYNLPVQDYALLAWADGLSGTYLNGVNAIHEGAYSYIDTKFPEPEAVFFRRSKFLGVQWHPEWMEEGTEGWAYFRELVANYIMRK